MDEATYITPKAQIIRFLESDLISISGVTDKDPDLGEWDFQL